MLIDDNRMPSSLAALPVEALETELTSLAGHLNAGNYRFLRVLGEFARREGYAGFGIASCAHWLSWKCGIGLVAAREKVRVARALETLPLIAEAMRTGKLSYCKARAITRVATAANESTLLTIAENGTVSHVEKTVRLFQRTERGEELQVANARYEDRYLQCYFDEQGQLVLRAQLPPEQGALFVKALQAAAEALDNASHEASQPQDAWSAGARRADALALMAETVLSEGASATAPSDRHLVTVHVAEQVLHEPTAAGQCHVEGQAPLPPATIRRLCCDGALVAIASDADGAPTHATRKTRVVPTAMRRALQTRDGGCRFPGCNNHRFVDAHHIVHWADGGDTTLDNLTLLCRKHHRFLHEYNYQIERCGRELRFLRPDGRHIPDVPREPVCDSEQGYNALRDAHNAEQLGIDATTGMCKWNGGKPSYDWLVGLLQARSGGQPRKGPVTALHMKRDNMEAQRDDLGDEAGDDEETRQMLRDQQLSTERSRLALSTGARSAWK
jgi:hypothetical protein